jgi:hypothetical protein
MRFSLKYREKEKIIQDKKSFELNIRVSFGHLKPIRLIGCRRFRKLMPKARSES